MTRSAAKLKVPTEKMASDVGAVKAEVVQLFSLPVQHDEHVRYAYSVANEVAAKYQPGHRPQGTLAYYYDGPARNEIAVRNEQARKHVFY